MKQFFVMLLSIISNPRPGISRVGAFISTVFLPIYLLNDRSTNFETILTSIALFTAFVIVIYNTYDMQLKCNREISSFCKEKYRGQLKEFAENHEKLLAERLMNCKNKKEIDLYYGLLKFINKYKYYKHQK
jgi:hypothetical protein